MLILAIQHPSCLPHIILIVCALTVQQIFMDKPKSKEETKEIPKEDAEAEQEDEEEFEILHTEQETKVGKQFKESRKKFESQKSDLISALKACGGFEFCTDEKSKKAFCEKNFLHYKNMKEIHSLREQLVKLLNQFNENATTGLIGNTKLAPPNDEEQLIIRQILCCGFIDQVAKEATDDEIEKITLLGIKMKRGSKVYISHSLGISKPLFIHPSSFLSKKSPKFLTYSELMESKSGYVFMRSVTEIKENWLISYGGDSLLEFSNPIGERFNEVKDRITCFVETKFGSSLKWKLSNFEKNYPSTELGFFKIKHGFELQLFVKYFMDGKIFKDISKYEFIHNTSDFTSKFVGKNSKELILKFKLKDGSLILSKKQLFDVWKQDPTFLKEEFTKWLKPKYISKLKWPPKE
jgi:hypothetical protein